MTEVGPWRWWEGRRRLRYNLFLLAGLALGFVIYVAAFLLIASAWDPATAAPNEEPPEFTALTVLVQGLAAAVGLVFANLLYLLGPLLDHLVPSGGKQRYRTWSYRLGVLLSGLLILGGPLLLLAVAVGAIQRTT